MRAPSYATKFEPCVWDVAQAAFGRAALEGWALSDAIRSLSGRFNRGEVSPSPITPPQIVFYLVGDLDKSVLAAAELDAAGLLVERGRKSPLRVLDIGAGAGAAWLGLLALLADRYPALAVEVTAIDRDVAALDVSRRVWQSARAAGLVGERTSVTALDRDVTDPLPASIRDPFDVILVANVLSEIGEASEDLLRSLLGTLGPRAALIAIEPALRARARRLQALRDRVLDDGAARAFAPCVRAGPCPALRDERDWCHEDRPWPPPPRLRALAHAAGLHRLSLKFSYLTLRLAAGSQVDPSHAADASAWRVVSEPLPTKGKHEVFLCGEADRYRARLLSRNRTEANRALESLVRGDLALLGGAPASVTGPRLEILTDTTVDRA